MLNRLFTTSKATVELQTKVAELQSENALLKSKLVQKQEHINRTNAFYKGRQKKQKPL